MVSMATCGRLSSGCPFQLCTAPALASQPPLSLPLSLSLSPASPTTFLSTHTPFFSFLPSFLSLSLTHTQRFTQLSLWGLLHYIPFIQPNPNASLNSFLPHLNSKPRLKLGHSSVNVLIT